MEDKVENEFKFKCKLCDMFFKTEKKWKKHLISKKHLDKINGIEIVPFNFQVNTKNTKNNIDPYLNEEDKRKLVNQGIGEGININFNNGNNNVKCNFENNEQPINNNILEEEDKAEVEKAEEEVEKKEEVEKAEEDFYDSCTEKQKQILKFLVKNQEHEQIHNKLFQVIQKLSLEDLDGFSMNLINCEDIKILIKEKLIKVIKIYKDSLLKKLEKGETHFNNNPISKIIDLLIV